MTQVTITVDITDKLCKDFLTTCYEGGAAYWLACNDVEYSDDRDPDYGVVAITGCYDQEDGETKWPDANFETIRTGIERILSGKVKVRADIIGDLLSAVNDPDYTGWDSETADCCLQAGLLGDVVYG